VKRRANRAAGRHGYTVVEVMMALVVLTLGAVGVIAMQKAVLVGNTNARNLATANSIAQTWVERLRADAQAWNDQGGTPDIAETAWLSGAATTAPAGGGGWIVTPASVAYGSSTPAGSNQADIMGADLLHAADKAKFGTAYCTQYRLTRFTNTPSGALASYYKVVRIEVRVVWDRLTQRLDCAALPANWQTNIGRYGAVYVVAAAMQNTAPF